MNDELLPFILFLSVITLLWLSTVAARIWPPKWIEVLADFEVMKTSMGRGDTFFGVHLMRLTYQVGDQSFEKLAPVRYNRRTLELDVLPQPDGSLAASKLLIRVHPKKHRVIDFQKKAWWHDAIAVLVLSILWTAIIALHNKS